MLKLGLRVFSTRLLALPASLASAVGQKNDLCEVLVLKQVVEPYIIAIERWFELAKTEMAPKTEFKNRAHFPQRDYRFHIVARTHRRKKIQCSPR